MNEMMETICTFDAKKLPIRHIPGPEGVRGRNSDNALILEKLGWEPTIKLAHGLKVTYEWIKGQLKEASSPAVFASLLPAYFPPPSLGDEAYAFWLPATSAPRSMPMSPTQPL